MMFQVDEVGVSHGNPNTEHENLSLVDIQRLIKQEKCEAEELPSDDDLHRITKKSEASSSKSKKASNVKRIRLQKTSKIIKKKESPPVPQCERLSNRELLAEMIKSEIMESDVRPVHTCKFCHRVFTSAFILCLHIQIHEKVNSVTKMFEQNKSAAVDPVGHTVNNEMEDESTSPSANTIDTNDTMEIVNTFPTVSQDETKKQPDASLAVEKTEIIQPNKLNSSSSKNADVETKNAKTAECSSSITDCGSVKIKTESIDESDQVTIKTEKPEPISFVKNNFVENLKKNLSLAMNRKL